MHLLRILKIYSIADSLTSFSINVCLNFSPASFKNREISNILWATAKLGLKPKHNAPRPDMQQIDVFKKVSTLTMQSIEAVIKTRDKSNIPKISELVRLIISGVAERLVEILFEVILFLQYYQNVNA